MNDIWTKRPTTVKQANDTLVNCFFKQQIKSQRAGKILLPAESDIHNALYATQKGWNVTTFENNENGKQKALELAKNSNLHIKYFVNGFKEAALNEAYFDALAFTFNNAEKVNGIHWFSKMINLVKPGGLVIFEGFSIDQLRQYSESPRSTNMLFSEESILETFHDLANIKVWEETIILNELDPKHSQVSVIRMVGKR